MGMLSLTGCVPIRQWMGSGPSASKPTPSKASSKGDFSEESKTSQSADMDAWKDELNGIASWYGKDFNGHLTASGEVYDMYQFTAAHKTLPLGTVVKVTNLENGQTAEVRVNDRGPYVKGRIIDLSRTAGRAIGMREKGTAKVKLEIIRWPKGSR